MKQLLTSLLLGLSVLASAQNDGIQYPFPYNPDGNSDGYISLPDMLDLLAVYGQAFPQSFYSDTTVAVLNLGRMGGHSCMQQAESAGSDWRIPKQSELPSFSTATAKTLANQSGSSIGCWFIRDDTKALSTGWTFSRENPNSLDTGSYDYILGSDSTELFRVNIAQGFPSTYTYLTSKSTCILVSELRPDFEFSYCNTNSGDEFEQCVTEKLNDGWVPMPGGANNWAGHFYQGFWRILTE